MAQAGGVTTAYKTWIDWDDKGVIIRTQHTSRLRSDCAEVDDALSELMTGATVIVAGGDMEELRRRLAEVGA